MKNHHIYAVDALGYAFESVGCPSSEGEDIRANNNKADFTGAKKTCEVCFAEGLRSVRRRGGKKRERSKAALHLVDLWKVCVSRYFYRGFLMILISDPINYTSLILVISGMYTF